MNAIRPSRTIRAAAVPLALGLALVSGCGGGQDVTAQALRDARATWERANIRDYDLEWGSTGAQRNRYRVFVRGGKVKAVHMLRTDGTSAEVHPATPEAFGVDGLFMVLEEELAQVQSERPFGQPKGTSVVLRFTPDPKLGYPRHFHRDVLGTPQAVAIDVLRLTPGVTGEVPRLPPDGTGRVES
jgi:hypothetical protein